MMKGIDSGILGVKKHIQKLYKVLLHLYFLKLLKKKDYKYQQQILTHAIYKFNTRYRVLVAFISPCTVPKLYDPRLPRPIRTPRVQDLVLHL